MLISCVKNYDICKKYIICFNKSSTMKLGCSRKLYLRVNASESSLRSCRSLRKELIPVKIIMVTWITNELALIP